MLCIQPMNYVAVGAEAANRESVVRGTAERGIALKVKDNVILAFFSVAYESAVILLRIRSRLIPR